MRNIFLFLLLISTSCIAGEYRVINVEEQTKVIMVREPTEVCTHNNYYNNNRHIRERTPLAGIIIGGAIGSRIGDGNGRTLSTIAGAAIGAHIQNNGRRSNYRYYNQNQYLNCHTEYVTVRKVVNDGYIVYYDYYGSMRSLWLDYYPNRAFIYLPY